MKLKTRLTLAFMTITVVPILLIFLSIWGVNNYQKKAFSKNYNLSEQVNLFPGNSIRIFNRLTQSSEQTIKSDLNDHPEYFLDPDYLDKINQELMRKYAYLIVRKEKTIIYNGCVEKGKKIEFPQMLPDYGNANGNFQGGLYLDSEIQHLIKQMDFIFPDYLEGSIFIVSSVDDLIPEVKSMIGDMILTSVLILFLAGIILMLWVYQSIVKPLEILQLAAKQIKDGNLDFTLEPETNDEIGLLYEDFEEMRKRLKESAEEKIQYDKENKELISNISHDLKTPITAIKGYVEGIMDGVASSQEKVDKYMKTIYHKANDMDRLIDELTFYSKIDTNKIPYTFSKINVANYFRDCIEEVGLDLDANNIELGYFNYVDEEIVVIADAEQLKRVVNNVIANSIKYIDKKKKIINIRIKDVGDFIQVEIEDNGRGIAANDISNIFERFYRTDASRNSVQGGSGIGLSIVRKIIEDHGGRIWATSKEGIGTEIHFVLRKYQEVIWDE